MPMPFRLEICCYSSDSVAIAAACGAHRVELCSGRLEGGTTPSLGMLHEALKHPSLGVFPILRPRGGDFCYTAGEFREMCYDIERMADAGVPGLVTGILLPNGRFDWLRMQQLMDLAPQLQWCVHRAFDMCRNPLEALDECIDHGITRILSSGTHNKAMEGIAVLEKLVHHAKDRIQIMAGSGVHASQIEPLWNVGIRHFHASASRHYPSPMEFRNPNITMGKEGDLDEYLRSETDPEKVQAMMETLRALSQSAS